ncbi:putative reverse transcriptase domain-containing protein [Tanacetum coccineum]
MKEENVKEENLRGMDKEFETHPNGTLYIEKQSWLPRLGGIRDLITNESRKSKYSIHPGSDKMYHDLKKLYWWPNIKNEIATYGSKCLTCAKDKAEYQKPSDGQSERTIQTLEDMLRACVIDFRNGWDRHFTSSRILTEVGDSQLTGPEIIHETTEKIIHIKNRIQVARDSQKSYADVRHKPIEFQVRDNVMLKVSP